MSTPLEAFGRQVQAVRASTDLSQEALAERSGFDRTYISLLERGRRNPSLLTVCRIAGGLGVEPTWLLMGVPAVSEDPKLPNGP